MQEFIEELKYNQNINFEKGLENRVDIDYVIERLENINYYDEYLKGEINFVIETIMNDDYVDSSDLEKIEKLNDDDINNICKDLYKVLEYYNSDINSDIEDLIFHYIHRNEVK